MDAPKHISFGKLIVIVIVSLIGGLLVYNKGFDKTSTLSSSDVLQEVAKDPEFLKYFGEGLQTLTILDTDNDGVADIGDTDADNDGVSNDQDDDVDGDGTPNSADPSSALVALIDSVGLTEPEKGDKGDKGEDGEDGSDASDGANGGNGSNGGTGSAGNSGTDGSGAVGPQGPVGEKGDKGDTGTVGVITNDGVVRTTLTGSALDIQLSLAAGSGLQKLSSGLSLISSCANNEILKWNGSAWVCASDDGGITYTEGDGITISAGVVTALLGTTVDSSEIVDAAVTLAKLSDDAVNSAKIVDGSITSLDLGTGSVITTVIANGAVTEVKIADGAISLNKVASDAINSAKIVDGSISTDDLANAAVTDVKLATDAVTSAKILDGTIATNDLADNLIVSAKLADGSVATAKLADDAVTTLKLADNAVTLAKLADDAVNSAKISDGTIVAADLADSSVTLAKLDSCGADGKTLLYFVSDPDAAGPLNAGWNCVDPSGEVDGVVGNEVTDATVSGGLVRSGSGTLISPYTLGIASNGVVTAMINADAVTTAKILDGTIGTTDLADAAIATAKLADGSVNTQKLLDSSVATAKIADGAVTLVKIGADAVDSSKIVDSSIASSDIQDNAVAYGDIQQVAANSLLGNATGASANVATIGLGSGLQFSAGNLTVASTVVTSLAAPSGSNANGGAITGNVLTLSLADGTNPGLLSSADWTTFSAKVGTSRQLLAGTGLTGGGNLSVDRTLSLDIAGLTGLGGSIDNLDEVAIYDASSGSIRKVTRSDFLSGLTGALIYQGTYNATTNAPTLTDGTGTQGHYYVVGTAGTQDFGSGNITFATGDWVVHNGTAWEKLFNSVTVASVFGRTGTITAQSGDYTAVQVTNVPAGALSATNLQTAVNELDSEKLSSTLNSGLLFVGNGSNVATGVALSGDAGITNAGVLTLTAGSVTSGKILDGTVAADDLAADAVTSTKIVDGTIVSNDLAANAVSYSKIQQATANRLLGNATGGVADVAEIGLGTGLVFDSGNLALGSNVVLSLGAPTGSSANGGSIASNVLTLSLADASNPGVVSTAAQTFAGVKTFNSAASFVAAGTALSVTNNALVGGGLTVTGNIVNDGNFTQNGTGTFATGTGAVTLNGNTTIAGSTTLTTGTGLTTVSGDASVVGAFALKKGTDYSVAGISNDANFGSVSLVRLTGASAQTINGIAGGSDGELLTIINAAAQAATISNQNSGSTATNRIISGTGTDINLAADASLSLVYDSGASRWRVVGGTGGSSSGGFSSLDIANDANGGDIGTAVATVDTYTNFNIVQTTASQAFTIPSPTNTTTTRGKIITINNTGTANFSISGVTVPAGSYGSAFVWNGTVWNPINAASNVAAEYVKVFSNTSVTTNISTGDHVKYNAISAQQGSSITPDISTGYTASNNTNSLGRFLLQPGKTYRLRGALGNIATAGTPGYAGFEWTNADTGATLADTNKGFVHTDGVWTTYATSDITAESVFTPTVPTRVELRLNTLSNFTGYGGSLASQRAWADIEVLSGNAPIVGQSVSYISARSTSGQSGASGTLGFVGGNVLSSNNMSLVGNTFVASSAGTYRIRAEVMGSSASGNFESINLSLLRNGSTIYTTPNVTVPEIDGYGAFGVPYYLEQVVNLNAGDNVSFAWGGSGGAKSVNIKEVNINQLGSTAFTTVAISALSNAVATNALDNTNFSQTWNWSTATSQNGLTLGASALTTGTLLNLDNTSTANTGLTINAKGSVAFQKGTDFASVGQQDNVNFGNTSLVRLTGVSLQNITGIAGGSDGELLTIINAAGQVATISNQSTASTAANRIITGTGGDLSLAADASLSLVYDSGSSRWRVVGGTGGSSAPESETVMTSRSQDLLFVATPSGVASSPTQWTAAPYVVTSQAEANRLAPSLIQKYIALMTALENDSTSDTILAEADVVAQANAIKATDSRYSSVTFTTGIDVDPTTVPPLPEYYKMLVAYNSVTGEGYFLDIMHTNPSSATQVASQTYWTHNGVTGAPTQSSTVSTYAISASSAATYSTGIPLLVPMWQTANTGNSTVNMVDYARATQASNQNPTVGTAINYTANIQGNMTHIGSGRYRLSAGKTYALKAAWAPIDNGAENADFQWYNVTGATFIGTEGSGGDMGGIEYVHGLATAIITPVVDTDVEVRYTFDNSGQSGFAKNWMEITQLGNTATTGVVMSALTGALESNALDNTNYTQTWNWSTATTETGLALNAGTGLTSGTLQALGVNSSAANFTGSIQALTVTGDSASDTGAASLITLAGSSSAAKGLQINNAGTGDAINVNATGTGLAANFGGAIALKKGTDYATIGQTNDVNFGNTSLIRLTGASLQTITGISGGSDGELLTIVNAAAQAATISNQSTASTAANRIITGTGADVTLAADASLSLVYDSGSSRWRVVGGTGGSGSTEGTTTLTSRQQDLFYVASTGSVASSPTQWTAAPYVVTSQAEANSVATAMIQKYTALMTAVENDSTSDEILSGTATITRANAIKAADARYSSVTFTGGVDVDPGVSLPVTEYYSMLVAYNSVTGEGYFLDIMHTNGAGSQVTGQTYWTHNATAGAPTQQGVVSTYARSASALQSYTVGIPILIPMWQSNDTGSRTVDMVDYYNITWSAGTTASPAIGAAYNFSVGTTRTQSGNIPFNGTSNWTLTAGKTYRLTANMAAGSVNGSQVAWYDDSTGLPISNNNASAQDNGTTNITSSGSADVIITPVTDRTVSIRALSSQPLLLLRSSVTITQLGSTTSTGVAMSTLTAALASNALNNANFTQTWNWDTLSTGNGLVANFNALTSGAGMNLASSSVGLTGSLARLDVTGNDAGVTGEAMLINIAGSSSAAKGLRIANAGTGLSADIQGAIALRAGTTYTTPGSANNVAFANASFIRMDTSGAAQTITGIAGGVDGKLLTLSNVDATEAVTLVNLSGLSLAANQIVTGTGADLTLADGASVSLIYDATDSKWRVVGGTGGGGSSNVVSNYYSAKGAVIDLDSAGTGTPVYVSLSTLASVVAGDYAGLTAAENDPSGLRTSADTLTIDQSGAYRVSVNMQHTGANLSGVAGQNQLDELVAGYSRNGVFTPIQGNDDTNNLPQDVNGSVIVDLTAGDTIRFGLANNASSFNDEDFIVNFTLEQVSGYAPVIGQSVDYVHVKKTTQQNVGTGAAVLFNTTESGNIPYNSATGEFTLTAGKTYRLESSLNGNTDGTANGSVSMYWVNSANTALTTNAAATSTVATSSLANFSNSTTSLVYTPVTSMVVKLYTAGNVAATDVDGGWATITQLGSSAVTVTDNVAQFGENSTITDGQSTASTSYVDVAGSSFTLPSAGTWDVTYNVFTNNNTGAAITMMQLTDNSGNAVPGSYSVMAEASGAGVTGGNWGRATITTTGSATYKLQWKVSGGTAFAYNNTTSAGGSSKISWNKISGLTPSTGQSAEAASFKLGSSWTSGAGTFVNTWQTSPTTGSTTITSSGTNFVIPANKSFTVNLSLLSQTGVHSTFTVRDVTGGAPGTQLGSALSIGLSEGGNYSSSSAQTVYIPASGTARTVSIRLDSINSSNPTLNASSSGITFTQVGTTATTGVAMSSFVAALATNALDNANFGQTWSWNALSAGDGLVIDSSSATASGNLLKFGLTNASATGTAVNITNAGTGLTLRINDDGTYSDSTPVAVDANGRLIIGGTSGLYDLTFGDNDTGIDWESDGVVSFRRNGQEMFRLDGDVANQGFQFNVASSLNGNACDGANEVLETTADGTLRCGTEDSDERLKNVYARNVLYGLDEILASELIQYDWNEASGRSNEDGITRYQGFSAQNIEQIAPELVFESFGGTYGVDQNGLIATAWNGIKQLNEKHEEFASEIGAQVSFALENGSLNGGIEVTGLSIDFGSEVTLAGALNYLSDKVGELDGRVTALEAVDPTVTNEITNVTNTTEQVTQNITQIIESTQQYGVAKVLSGKGGVRVTFSNAFATTPAVFVTPMNGGNYTIQQISTTSFVIMLSEATGEDTMFSWMAAELDPNAVENGEQLEAPSAPIVPNTEGDGEATVGI